MKVKMLGEKMLSQCEGCQMIEMLTKDNKKVYQHSICMFPTLPKKPCYSCKIKT